jgi:hypothetical protein
MHYPSWKWVYFLNKNITSDILFINFQWGSRALQNLQELILDLPPLQCSLGSTWIFNGALERHKIFRYWSRISCLSNAVVD